MNEFPTLEKQSRALFWIVKKLIDVRDDKKQPREQNPQFINLPTLERDENTSLEKILKQARYYNNDLEIKTTVSIPKELKTVEIQKIQEGIFNKDKTRVNGIKSLKQ